MQPVSFTSIPSEYRSNVSPLRENTRRPSENTRFSNYDGSDERYEALKKSYNRAVEIANLKDQQLLSIAKADASRDDKYKFGTYAAALVGVPVVDTFLRGTFSKAPTLAGKLNATGKAAAGWAGVIALAGIYNGIYNKITAVTPVLRKNEDRHPVMSSLLRLAGFAAVLVGTQKGIGKLAQTLPQKAPGLVADISKAKSVIAAKINNSALNNKIAKPIAKKAISFAEKHPKLAGTTISALALSVPFMAFGALFKAFSDKAEKTEKIKDTYNKLVEARETSRDALDSIHSQTFMNEIKKEVAKAVSGAQDNEDYQGFNALA